MTDIETKVCSKCLEVKSIDDFHRYSRGRYKRQSRCKKCNYADNTERQQKNPEKANKSNRKYYKKNGRNREDPSQSSACKAANKYLRENHPPGYDKYGNPRLWHHGCYLPEHLLNVILLSVKDHYRAHSLMTRGKDEYFFRVKETGELLDNKEKHIAFLKLNNIQIHAELYTQHKATTF
jgi:hypothetical protein